VGRRFASITERFQHEARPEVDTLGVGEPQMEPVDILESAVVLIQQF
jgi:hypothetical protein